MTTSQHASSEPIPDELHPCEHMVNLVSRRSDGSLSGPAKWYTDFHVLTCPNCRAALHGLQQLRKVIHDEAQCDPAPTLRLHAQDWKNVEEARSVELKQ